MSKAGRKYGHIVTQETREKISRKLKGVPKPQEFKDRVSKTLKEKNMRGSKHHAWKGGLWKHHGYAYVYAPSHPHGDKDGYVKRAHIVMERKIGRYLKPKKEIVHHINGIKDDDRPENLMLFANDSEHQKYHYSERRDK